MKKKIISGKGCGSKENAICYGKIDCEECILSCNSLIKQEEFFGGEKNGC